MNRTLNMVLLVVAMGLIGGVFFRGGGADSAVVAERVERGALIIDVRTADEFSRGHIEGAINIPHDEIDRLIHQAEPEMERGIVVYCRSGRRSAIAKDVLARVGYTNVVNAGSFSSARAALEK